MLAEAFCPPGKWTSTPAPPLVTAFVADPSVNTWIQAAFGYLSAIIAGVRDCFAASFCVSPPESEGTVVWTLMSIMSVTQGSVISGGKKGSVLWGSLSWNWWLSFLLSRTKLLLFSRFLVRPSSLVFMGWFVMHLNFSACIMFLASVLWPRGWTPVRLSISVIGVDRIALVIKRSAWFWRLSRACWLVFAVVDHAVEPYSRWGLTVPWYTVFSIFSLAPQVVPASLRRIVSLRLVFVSALAVCCFQVCLLSNMIPRYVAASSSFSGVHQEWWCRLFALGIGWTRWWKTCPCWLRRTISESSCWACQPPAASCMWLQLRILPCTESPSHLQIMLLSRPLETLRLGHWWKTGSMQWNTVP